MLDDNTKNLLNINNDLANKLEKLNINSIWDLILHIPYRYENDTTIQAIKDVTLDEKYIKYIVKGKIIKQQIIFNRYKNQLLLTITDDCINTLNIRFIHFYPNQQKVLAIGKIFYFKGQIRNNLLGLEMVHPIIKSDIFTTNTNKLTGIYSLTSGITQETMQNLIKMAFKIVNLNDTLPKNIIQPLNLCSFKESIIFLHNPTIQKTYQELQNKINFYKQRLKFDELLAQQLSMTIARQQRNKLISHSIECQGILQQQLQIQLNFKLTYAQEKVLSEIKNDLKKNIPMNRLLQGDVGSGKTIVAALTALNVVESGLQVAIIAPTEILAEQHFKKFTEWTSNLNISIKYLTSKHKYSEKNIIKKELIEKKIDILIGTHAIFQKNIIFFNLGLVIIDEQHRFGVQQRLMLKNKGHNVHQLMMSATPIPRTLTMSYFADLDLSVIDELPSGRKKIINKLINSNRINQVEKFIYNHAKKQQQIYWVCPLIEESERLQLTTVNQTAVKLKQIFHDLSIGVIHGKLKSQEKTTIMEDFKNQKIDILVATSVIEVGIDVPNASLMVIENSERIGLSQLHQLRGRIGRGENQSICIFMFCDPLTEIAKQRLKVIYENNDGFEISKYDLQLRGPGEVLGIKQSGADLFKFIDLNQDSTLLQFAKQTVQTLIKNNNSNYIEKHLKKWSNHQIHYLNV